MVRDRYRANRVWYIDEVDSSVIADRRICVGEAGGASSFT